MAMEWEAKPKRCKIWEYIGKWNSQLKAYDEIKNVSQKYGINIF